MWVCFAAGGGGNSGFSPCSNTVTGNNVSMEMTVQRHRRRCSLHQKSNPSMITRSENPPLLPQWPLLLSLSSFHRPLPLSFPNSPLHPSLPPSKPPSVHPSLRPFLHRQTVIIRRGRDETVLSEKRIFSFLLLLITLISSRNLSRVLKPKQK